MTVAHSTHPSDAPERRSASGAPVTQAAMTASIAEAHSRSATAHIVEACYGDAAFFDTPANSLNAALDAGDCFERTEELLKGLL